MMRSFGRKLLALLILLAILLALAVSCFTAFLLAEWSSPRLIMKETGFSPAFSCTVYCYDATESWRDADVLRIILIGKLDRRRFADHLDGQAAWQPLPIPAEAAGHFLLDPRFDAHMPDMIRASTGYWFCDTRSFYVYDSARGLLYMRLR
ncbi:MAG: hypothetical protein IJS53_02455 [Clostridia bacterium]|nr:hypothetical protein [Clostridia bacterium]